MRTHSKYKLNKVLGFCDPDQSECAACHLWGKERVVQEFAGKNDIRKLCLCKKCFESIVTKQTRDMAIRLSNGSIGFLYPVFPDSAPNSKLKNFKAMYRAQNMNKNKRSP